MCAEACESYIRLSGLPSCRLLSQPQRGSKERDDFSSDSVFIKTSQHFVYVPMLSSAMLSVANIICRYRLRIQLNRNGL